jgi:hypothetical protein
MARSFQAYSAAAGAAIGDELNDGADLIGAGPRRIVLVIK